VLLEAQYQTSTYAQSIYGISRCLVAVTAPVPTRVPCLTMRAGERCAIWQLRSSRSPKYVLSTFPYPPVLLRRVPCRRRRFATLWSSLSPWCARCRFLTPSRMQNQIAALCTGGPNTYSLSRREECTDFELGHFGNVRACNAHCYQSAVSTHAKRSDDAVTTSTTGKVREHSSRRQPAM